MILLRGVIKHVTVRLQLSQFEVQIACLHMELRKPGNCEPREIAWLIEHVISDKENG
jgi:hypothetical protein